MKTKIKLSGLMLAALIVPCIIALAFTASCTPKKTETVTATPLTDFEIDGTTLVKYIGNDTAVVIPHGITEIGVMAFSGKGLTGVSIRNSVAEIGTEAFARNQLTGVYIPDSVTFIGDQAFAGNPLTMVNIGDNGEPKIGWNAFSEEYEEVP